MTPVFGLETDESYEVQQTKKEYEVLREKEESLNNIEKQKLKSLRQSLKTKLPQRKIISVTENELSLLNNIERSLKITE
jgi:hypothetical protein